MGDWQDVGWVAECGAHEGWGEREWSAWEQLLQRLDEGGVMIDPEGPVPQIAGIHAWRKGGGWETYVIVQPRPMAVHGALLELVEKLGERPLSTA